jgi:hypothetical protein
MVSKCGGDDLSPIFPTFDIRGQVQISNREGPVGVF